MCELSRLTEINLMEQFVNGVGEFAGSIVQLKSFENKLRILKEIRGNMFTAKLQSRREFSLLSVLYFQVPTC